ncbi:MAG TPA: hypothetical protein DCQ58_00200, partial [Saprospirales bacterium]|nr:hypothetical protein [Saprospirales bacterium]
ESSAFIFKEIGNKYNNYNEYFSKNKSTANPYHIFLISGLGGKMSEELPGNLYRLFSLASKAGLFFLINFEKRTFEFFLDHEPELIKALENHLFMYDLSERKCKSIIPDLDLWYNKIFNINHNAKIEFNNYHIGLINYEFDPVKYPKPVWNDNEVLPLDRPANDSIQNVFLKMGVDDTGEKLDIVIDDIRKNILLLSNGETANNSIFKHLLYLLASEYGPSEIEINCFGLNSDTFRFTQNLTHCSIIVSGKNPVYLEGFMQNLNVELQRRRDLFANAPVSISSYSEYRKISDDSLPRLFVLIQGLDEIISNASDLFSIELIEKLSQLLKDCNNFGIHFLIFIEPEEKILSMDLNQYDYRLFYLSDAAKSKSFANLSIPLCEHLKDPEKVLVFSLSDNKTDICTIKPKDEKSIFEHFSRIPDFSGPQHTEKLILNSFDVPQIGSIPDNQKPISEDGTIDLYIGASQWFTPDTNYKLTLPKNQTPNVMICGNDQKTCHSLLHSMQIQLADVCKITVLDFENQLQSSKMALDRCNILKSNAEFAELFDKFKDLAENSRNNPGVLSPQREVHLLFVVNTDKLMNHPDKNIIFSRLSYLLQNTSETGIRLFVQINDKSAFDDDHLTVFSKYTFGTSIICKGANESLLSSLTLMDYKIGIPEEGGKVLIETVNKRSDFVADPVKLYQIG